jgi:prepilin-type N-terminal cleavage/methylation domain-containing protein/prepilin-type processing-associated H-X9-DG protein
MSTRASKTCSPAFTLIELLVVIAILAVLAGILFPVFASAREKARETICMSNLKQIGAAVMLYTQDCEGTYPSAQAKDEASPPVASEENFVNWAELVYPYIKNGSVLRKGKLAFAGGVFHCPSDNRSRGPSYAINAWVLFGLHEAEITRSTESVILAEKRGSIPQERFVWWSDPWPGWPLKEGTPIKDREPAINAIDEPDKDDDDPTPDSPEQDRREAAGLQTLRHHGGSNWMFGDGHVKWSRLERIWGNATSTNQLWPTRR